MNEDYLRSYFRVYNSEDPEQLESLYHPDVTLRNGDIEIKGRDQLIGTYREMIANFHDKMSPSFIEESEGAVSVQILDTLTAKCDIFDFMGQVVAEGDSLYLKLRGKYEFEDGKIRRISLEIIE